MSHIIRYNSESKIIETSLSGLIHAEEIIEIMFEAAELTIIHKSFLWLNDFTNADFSLSTFDIYSFPNKIEEATKKLGEYHHLIKRAIVSPKIGEDHKFAEAMSTKKGQSLKTFRTVTEARIWLHEDHNSVSKAINISFIA